MDHQLPKRMGNYIFFPIQKDPKKIKENKHKPYFSLFFFSLLTRKLFLCSLKAFSPSFFCLLHSPLSCPSIANSFLNCQTPLYQAKVACCMEQPAQVWIVASLLSSSMVSIHRCMQMQSWRACRLLLACLQAAAVWRGTRASWQLLVQALQVGSMGVLEQVLQRLLTA